MLDDEAAAVLATAIGRERRLGGLPGRAWSTASAALRVTKGLGGSALDDWGAGPQDGAVPELLTLDEAGHHLRLSASSVKRLVADGRLRVVHVGRATRVHPADLRTFVDGLRTPSTTEPA